jgi:tetratricopeptide (TPR) repeat protein
MSYINEALKKAQEEKNGRYECYRGIISRPPPAGRSRRTRWLIAGVFACIVLAAGVWVAFNLGLWLGERPVPVAAKPARPVIVDREPPPAIAPNDATGVPGEVPVPAVTAPAAPASVAGTATGPAAPVPPAVPAKTLAANPPRSPAAPATPGPETKAAQVGTAPAKTPLAPPAKTAGTPVRSLYRQALALQKKKDLAGAADLYRQVVKLDPKHAYAWNNLGVIQMRQKEDGKAIASFKRAAALKDGYADPYYNLACAYAQSGDKAQSLVHLKKAASLNGEVLTWAKEDTDLALIVQMPEFHQLVEGQGK